MSLRKTSIRGIDLDEFARQLREFQKSSTVDASEYCEIENAQKRGGEIPKSDRENARDQPASLSPVHARQKTARSSTSKVSVDDVERQLREAASLANRKSRLPSKNGGLVVQGDRQPSATLGRRVGGDVEAAAAVTTPQLGVLKASWRPVILQQYGEQSVWARCARSLALPLLLLSLGTGAFVVLSPEGALTNIDRLLEDGRVKQAKRDVQEPVQRDVASAASMDRPKANPSSSGDAVSTAPTMPGVTAPLPTDTASQGSGKVASPLQVAKPIEPKTGLNIEEVAEAPAPVGAGSIMPQASPSESGVMDSPTPDATVSSSITPETNRSSSGSTRDAVSESPASTLTNVVMPTAAPPATLDSAASLSLLAKSIDSKTGSNGDAVFGSAAPVVAGSATPQASMSLPATTLTPTPDTATSFAIASSDLSPSSTGEAVSAAPASVLAALGTSEVPTFAPTATPARTSESAAPSVPAKSDEPKTGVSSDAVSETPIQESVYLPMATASPTGDRAPSPSLDIASDETILGSPRDVFSKVRASVLEALAILELPKALTIGTAPPGWDDAASTSAEIAANILVTTPADGGSRSDSPDRVDPRSDSTEQAIFQAPSSATPRPSPLQPSASPPALAASPAPDGAALKVENIAGDRSNHPKPRPDGETAFDTMMPLGAQQVPAPVPAVSSPPPNTLAQAMRDTPIEGTNPSVAQLIVAQKESGVAGAALPLPVSLNSAPTSAIIVIQGLAAGSTLTMGRALEVGSWQLKAGELHDAVLWPPQGFAGVMELGLELRLPDGSVADRKMLHLEWTAGAGPQAMKPAFVVRHLDSDEVTALLKRGEGFIASGDLASARLVLQRAAEAGDAQAALSLAGTFDPIMLDRLGLQGQKADIEKARTWYQRAEELGSAAAPRRLQFLAGYNQ